MKFRQDAFYKTAYNRLRKVDSAEVNNWAASTLWATQAGLEGFRATYDVAALQEARRGALSLLAATDVLLDRHDK